MNAILNELSDQSMGKKLMNWPHQEVLSSKEWTEVRAAWKKNNKNIKTQDIVLYLLMKSHDKEMFINKLYKAFTPLTNKNKLKDKLAYHAGIYAILESRNLIERAIKLVDKNPQASVQSLASYKIHDMYILLAKNPAMCHKSIDWLNQAYATIYKK